MRMWEWYKARFFTLQGRLNRRQLVTYFGALYGLLLVGLALMFLLARISTYLAPSAGTAATLTGTAILLPVLIVYLVGLVSLGVRRFHDLGRSGYAFLGFAFVLNLPKAISKSLDRLAPNTFVLPEGWDAVLVAAQIAAGVVSLVVLSWPGASSENNYGMPPHDAWTLPDAIQSPNNATA